MTDETTARTYRKVERARREEETRLRITRAAVELHRAVGPASTTITDIAKLAGVSRMTVYNHFPTDVDLFRACSTHWARANPFPDLSRWAGIDDPPARLDAGLRELYAWYAANADMLGGVFRDLGVVPALAEVMAELWAGYAGEVIARLADGWRSPNARGERIETALTVVVDFRTWQMLADTGSDPETAARIAGRLVTGGFAAATRTTAGRG
ncbi:MAG: TetR/AcrR family transcriptional regulator [Gemmatimonadota bacterium]|nr:TetR/AcrR family transcriptional regulator [Gemmatimonadota bacterium]